MTYKTILVQVDSSRASDIRIDYATSLAAEYEAHLIGLYVTAPTPLGIMPTGHSIYGQQIQDARDQAMRENANSLCLRFEDRVKQGGWSRPEWHYEAEETWERAAALRGRYCDLLVVGQHDPDDPESVTGADFPADVAIAAGRPSLVVPHANCTVGRPRRILVAWNASREAARAVADSLPLLRRAERVQVLVVNSEHFPTVNDAQAGEGLARYLARQGIKAQVVKQSASTADVGDVLMSRALDLDVEMMVMGAYGHSRLREIVLGGATRAVLRHTTIPVLMAH
ncbi:MAG: universal stress protein [Nitrococcus sp.]|nr:universal stress protein [Nitrococcus sp.]